MRTADFSWRVSWPSVSMNAGWEGDHSKKRRSSPILGAFGFHVSKLKGMVKRFDFSLSYISGECANPSHAFTQEYAKSGIPCRWSVSKRWICKTLWKEISDDNIGCALLRDHGICLKALHNASESRSARAMTALSNKIVENSLFDRPNGQSKYKICRHYCRSSCLPRTI